MTLLEALQAIPDTRTKKERRFALPTMLLIALALLHKAAQRMIDDLDQTGLPL